jgi:hypothetical protein
MVGEIRSLTSHKLGKLGDDVVSIFSIQSSDMD